MTTHVIVDPRTFPVGHVLEHPEGRGKVYRREEGDETGRGQHVWHSLPGFELPTGRVLHHNEVVGWRSTGEVAEW